MPKAAASFVGRERELAELQSALDAAFSGRGGLYLLIGEPGIGKSRLADELGIHASHSNAHVLWGRSWEGEGTPAYWPWVQVARSLVLGSDPTTLGSRLRGNAGYLAQLAPEIAERVPDLVRNAASKDSEQVRFALFDAVVSFLSASSEARPLVIILDDLHWADEPSLVLLDFVARELASMRTLLVGAYREVEAHAQPEIARLLARIARHGHEMPLRGLTEADVASVIEQSFGLSISAPVLSAVHAMTDGNPFFVDEVVRLLVAEGRIDEQPEKLRVPSGVRETIRQRIDPLSSASVDILTVASVVGRDFSLPVLESASLLSRPEILRAIQEAEATGLVATRSPGSYTFSHALVRETLYEDLDAVRRSELHRSVGTALERIYRTDAQPHLAELAHHFFQAALGGSEPKAVTYGRRAGDQATALFAYEQAAGHYERALEALDPAHPIESERCELLLALGDAAWRAGSEPRARDVFQRAAGSARELDDAEMLARAALGYGTGIGGQGFTFAADRVLIDLLEEALHALGEQDSLLRARCLARLAAELYWTDQAERRVRLGREAVEMARRLGDVPTELVALYSLQWALLAPDTLEERLVAAQEILELASRVGDNEMRYWGHQFRFTTLAELGDFDGVDEGIEACGRLADELRMPLYRWQVGTWRAGRALWEGRLDDAERLAADAHDIGELAKSDAALIVYGAQIAVVRWLQGRSAEVQPALEGFSAAYPWIVAWRAAMALFYCDLGREAEAQVELDRIGVHEFSDIPRDGGWLPALWVLSPPCAYLRDTKHAALLYELLLPYEERWVVIPSVAIDFGALASVLGMLATTLGRWDDADRHFRRALTGRARSRNAPMTAMALREYAAMLLARAAPGDVERAQQTLNEALTSIQNLGLTGLMQRAQELAEEAVRASDSRPLEVVFRRDQNEWTISASGVSTKLRDIKGLHYLHLLVERPGREFHALDLVVTAQGALRNGGRVGSLPELRVGSDDAGPVLDEEAKTAYRLRLADLHEELAEARDWNDSERAARAQEEIDALKGELARGVGLGGRDRPAASAAERARLNVTRAIRSAIARIAEDHPDLGRHLSTAVRTGTFCSYDPGPAAAIDWTL